ncbi:MAG TPA: sigma-70 family RNA polymerase sigma factor [Puia sp.]
MEIAILVKDAAKGNAAAQKCLFDRFADPMMAVCCRYVKGREDAEEVLLDGFFKFFKHLPGFVYQGDAALYGWIKMIMVRESLMFLRKKNVFTMLAEVEAENIPSDAEILSDLSAAEIFNLIVQLPVGYRTVFNLHVMEGMEHKAIAEELGIAEGTSKSQLSKARVLLQKMLLQKGISYGQRKTQ